ncbi:MAG: ferrochelatase [Pseudomonadales bacterium]|nr:ferrochelatase [Pseudomonadales bacterium]
MDLVFSRRARILSQYPIRSTNLQRLILQKTGYLLINLGTPEAPDSAAVRRYLDEFLMDEYVIATPWLLRRLLVSLLILPFRPRRSAEAYAKIWSEDGSPLLLHSRALAEKLAIQLDAPVELGMRYGQPSIRNAATRLRAQDVDDIVVVPLYPQFADSSVTTSVRTASIEIGAVPHRFLAPFFRDQGYISALANLIGAHLPNEWDHLLLSYHGLPEQHIENADPTDGHCLKSEDCCAVASTAHKTCYRHQAFATSEALAETLGLTADQYTISFQSRLGRLPWLRPYTDEVLAQLPKLGVQRLVVACPAFVADNLETLEEIAIQGKDIFLTAGGTSFDVVPCLNDDPEWVAALAHMLTAVSASSG